MKRTHAAVKIGAAVIGAALLVTGCSSAKPPSTPNAGAAVTSAAKLTECQTLAQKYSSLKGKSIVVGSSPGPSNYDAPDPANPNKVVGVEPDLLTAAGKCVGFTHTVKKLDFGGLIPALQAKQIQAIASGMYASDERAKQVNFVQYMKASEASLVRKGNPKKITSLDTMCGVTASETVGTVENAIIDKQSKKCVADGKPAIKILSYQGNQAIDAVGQGRADVFLTDSGVASYLADRNKSLEVGFPIVSDFVFGIAVNKGDADLLNALQDTFSAFYTSGQMKTIVTKWGFNEAQIVTPSIKS